MIPLRDTLPSRSTPGVTILIILANVLIFLYQISLEPFARNEFVAVYGLVPARFDLSSLVTSMFLHGGWMHLILNMWILWIYGDNVEDILGHGKYLVFYVACGVAAALAQYAINPHSRLPVIGASGAIAGVMGAYMVKFPSARILTLVPIFVFVTTMEVPAVVILIYWFVLQIFSGIGSIGYSHLSQGGVAWWAHIGGFVAGMILVATLNTRPRYRRRYDLNW